MINDVLLRKVKDIMACNEMVFLTGQLRNIQGRKTDKGDWYYVADLRVPKNQDIDDIYSVSFNIFHICIPTALVQKEAITNEIMAGFKDNEVIVSLSCQASIHSKQTDNKDVTNKFNNIKLFVNDILLLNKVDRPDYSSKKVVNI